MKLIIFFNFSIIGIMMFLIFRGRCFFMKYNKFCIIFDFLFMIIKIILDIDKMFLYQGLYSIYDGKWLWLLVLKYNDVENVCTYIYLYIY